MTPATGLRLNLGCGPVQPEGWVNVDGSNRAWLATRLRPIDRLLTVLSLLPATEFGRNTTYLKIRNRLPWSNGTAQAIYLGEVLEHFTHDAGSKLIGECYRILESRGVLRVRVPDTLALLGRYVDEGRLTSLTSQSQWNSDHVKHLQLFFADICARHPGLGSMGHYHKWAYDEVALILALQRAGFRDVKRMQFHESRIDDVAAVELQDKLIVEGIKL